MKKSQEESLALLGAPMLDKHKERSEKTDNIELVSHTLVMASVYQKGSLLMLSRELSGYPGSVKFKQKIKNIKRLITIMTQQLSTK